MKEYRNINMKLRIEKEEYINKTFRLNVKLVREMEKISDDKMISLNRLVSIFIRYSLDNLESNNEQ